MNRSLPPLEQITATNASKLAEIARIGNGKAEDVCYTPDGRYLLVGSSTGIWRLNISNTNDNQPMVIGQYLSGKSMAVSHDSQFVASATKSGVIKVWDISTGACHATFKKPYDMYVQSLAFHPDNIRVASGDWDAV